MWNIIKSISSNVIRALVLDSREKIAAARQAASIIKNFFTSGVFSKEEASEAFSQLKTLPFVGALMASVASPVPGSIFLIMGLGMGLEQLLRIPGQIVPEKIRLAMNQGFRGERFGEWLEMQELKELLEESYDQKV